MLITTVIVAYIAYTHVVCASMHVLFPVWKFLMCAIAFAPGKLRVVLKLADQSRAGSHFNSQNTHSQFRNSQLAFYPCPNNLLSVFGLSWSVCNMNVLDATVCVLLCSCVVLIPEESEDMWHAYNLISVGDVLKSTTIRFVTKHLTVLPGIPTF